MPCPDPCLFSFLDTSQEQHQYCDKNWTIRHIQYSNLRSGAYTWHYSDPFQTDALKLMHLNVRNLSLRMADMKALLINQSVTPDVIAVTETWLEDNAMEALGVFQLPGYSFRSSVRQTGTRGGVGIYVKNQLQYEVLTMRIEQSESIFIKLNNLRLSDKPIIIGSIYSTPVDRNDAEFFESLSDGMQLLTDTGSAAFLLGDFNVDLFSIRTTHSYYETLVSNSFFNTVAFPTRITDHSATLIDHILTNCDRNLTEIESGVIRADFTDHDITFANIVGLPAATTHALPGRQFCFKNYSAEALNLDLSHIDWSEVTNSEDPKTAYNAFTRLIAPIQEKHIPEAPRCRPEQRRYAPRESRGPPRPDRAPW